MSKNTDLGNLVNGLFVDSSRNVAIGTTTALLTASNRGNLTINGSASSILTLGVAGGYSAYFFADATKVELSTNEQPMTFVTNGVERMRITSAGNVGIGTSSPEAFTNFNTLTVDGTSGSILAMRTNGTLNYRIGTNSGEAYLLTVGALPLVFYTNTTQRMRITQYGNVLVNATSSAYGASNIGYNFGVKGTNNQSFISIARANQTLDSEGIILGLDASSAYMVVNDNIPLIFFTNATERMRITSAGNVLIGTTTVLDKFVVNGGVRTTGTASGNFFDDRSSSNFFGWYAQGGQPFFFNGAVGNIVSINPSNGAYSALSDVNKKKNFEQSTIGLNEVMQLKPTLYNLKSEDDSFPKDLGFIAQEVKELIPQAYSESGEGNDKFIGLNQMPLIAALTKAIQELKAEIETLKNK